MKKKPIVPMIPILVSLLLVAAISLWFLDPVRNFGGNKIFHVSLGSSIFADYGSDYIRGDQVEPLSLNIFDEVIRDIQELIDPGKILRERQTPTETLQIPPTASVYYSMTPLPVNPTNATTTTPLATGVNTASTTPGASSTSPGHHGTQVPTATPTIITTTTVVGTLTPNLTPTPTLRGYRTFVPPTATPTFTPTYTPTFFYSSTPTRAATSTSFPTATFPPPTPTPISPTSTPTTQTSGYPPPTTNTPLPTTPGYP